MDDDSLPWPQPPIWPKHLANIRALLSAEEWRELERRLVHLPVGRLVLWNRVVPVPGQN